MKTGEYVISDKPISALMRESTLFIKDEDEYVMQSRNVNLEEVIKEEILLWNIYSTLKLRSETVVYCQEWWTATARSSVDCIEDYFSNEGVRSIVGTFLKMEILAVGFTEDLCGHSRLASLVLGNNRQTLTNVMFYAHQNFLLLMQILINRLSKSSANVCTA